MIVKRITLDFFRNYLHLECAFSPATNVIYGENAQGKTNLLEAVAYLSTEKNKISSIASPPSKAMSLNVIVRMFPNR